MSLMRKFASVGGATMASRVLGFAREALIGAALGAGAVADVFYAAFGFPNLFRRILAEGAFNSAFIPLFAKELEAGGKSQAQQFGEAVLAVLVPILLVLTLLAMVFMPSLVTSVLAPGFASDPAKTELTVSLGRIMFPYLFFMSLTAMMTGMLNSMRIYFLPALAPVLLNVILVGIAGYAVLMATPDQHTGLYLSWGVFASGACQLLLLAYACWREGLWLNLKWPRLTPRVKHMLALMLPAVITGGVVQINIMVGRIIASSQDGAIALLNYADRINQLPLGVIGIAVGVVLLPELSRALKSRDDIEANNLQNKSLEFAMALTLPAAIGLAVMPAPIVNILFERGAFDAETTQLTAAALAAFASGLPAYVLIKVFQPGYFAREDMRSPLWFSLISVIVNIGLSLWLFPLYGYVAIALATALSSWLNVVMLAGFLAWQDHFKPSATTLKKLMVMAIASVAMGGFLWLAQYYGAGFFASPSTLMRLFVVTLAISFASVIYFAIVIFGGAIPSAEMKRFFKRR